MSLIKSSLAILFCLAAPLIAEERPTFYPFDITLGETKAKMKAGNELFAEVSKPVADDAVLALEKQVPMLIVPGTYLANVVAENQTSRIFLQMRIPVASIESKP